MGGHLVHQVKAGHAIDKTRVVVHPVGDQYLAAGRAFFDEQGLDSPSGCIQTGSQARRAAADNYQLVLGFVHGLCHLSKISKKQKARAR